MLILLDDGFSYKEVAQLLLIGEGTVRSCYSKYLEDGIDGALSLHHHGKSMKLKEIPLSELSDFIEKNTPSSALIVRAYIEKTWGIQYSLAGVTAILHRLGFKYKKPKLIPGKLDPLAQEQFCQELEGLKNKLGKEDKILYMDGVHPQHNSKPAYGWFRKGQRAFLRANTGRKRLNINGAFDPLGLKMTYRSEETINAQSTIELFKDIEKKYPEAKKIVVICDNARYYRSSMITGYVNNSRIELKFLPPYSPNLNLIERLWLLMNKKVRNNKYYEQFKDFQAAIYGFFENIEIYSEELRSLMTQKFFTYKFNF